MDKTTKSRELDRITGDYIPLYTFTCNKSTKSSKRVKEDIIELNNRKNIMGLSPFIINLNDKL